MVRVRVRRRPNDIPENIILRSMQMKQPKLIIRVLSSMDDDGSKKHILHLVHHVFVPIIQQKNED